MNTLTPSQSLSVSAAIPLSWRPATRCSSPRSNSSRVLGRRVAIPRGAQVLDLGCGVGVLAIMAALQGAAHVDAVDIMPQACALVEFNARLNGVADRCDCHQRRSLRVGRHTALRRHHQ